MQSLAADGALCRTSVSLSGSYNSKHTDNRVNYMKYNNSYNPSNPLRRDSIPGVAGEQVRMRQVTLACIQNLTALKQMN